LQRKHRGPARERQHDAIVEAKGYIKNKPENMAQFFGALYEPFVLNNLHRRLVLAWQCANTQLVVRTPAEQRLQRRSRRDYRQMCCHGSPA
jgi:hypothetical protein